MTETIKKISAQEQRLNKIMQKEIQPTDNDVGWSLIFLPPQNKYLLMLLLDKNSLLKSQSSGEF